MAASALWNVAVATKNIAHATAEAIAPSSPNPSTLSGAVDIIIVKHSDSHNVSYRSTPWHVRFGKYQAQNPLNLNVTVTINGKEIDGVNMTLNEVGIAHFDGPKEEEQENEEEEEHKDSESIPTADPITNPKAHLEIESEPKSQNLMTPQRDSDDENEDEEKEQSSTTKKAKDAVKSTKNAVRKYFKSQWMIDEKMLKINDVPSEVVLTLFVMKLKEGRNAVTFSIETPSKMDKLKKSVYGDKGDDTDSVEYQMKQRTVSGNIYFWNSCDRVVISDVDGTITKSDARGHILTKIGFECVHKDIVEILGRINGSGYRILYVTARGIGFSSTTRKYLFDNLNVPNGAVLCSPSTTRAALYRELIQRRPEEFKIPTLNAVIRAFAGRNPFVAGFGNRDSDALSYHAVGIGADKTFIIGLDEEQQAEAKKGGLNAMFINDYSEILKNVNNHFPKV